MARRPCIRAQALNQPPAIHWPAMLFNSIQFLALYLPITMLGFFWLGARSKSAAAWWLALASLVFYAGWSWRYVPLLLASVGFNFACGLLLSRARAGPLTARALL